MQPAKCDMCKKYYDADKYEVCPHCATAAPAAFTPNDPVYEPVINTGNNPGNVPANDPGNIPVSNEKKGKKSSAFSFSKLISPKNKTAEPKANVNNNADTPRVSGTPHMSEVRYDNNQVDAIFAIEPEENMQTEPAADNNEHVAIKPEEAPVKQEVAAPAKQATYTPAPAAAPVAEPEEKEEKLSDIVKQAESTGGNSGSKTVAYYNFSNEIDPVVGWLVCIKGEYKGESFKLKSGRNYIGRSLTMDVSLAMEKSVSRERHAAITFDPYQRRFFIQNGDSRGLTYVNNELLLNFKELNKGDIIAVSSCELMFYPLCGEDFSWDD